MFIPRPFICRHAGRDDGGIDLNDLVAESSAESRSDDHRV